MRLECQRLRGYAVFNTTTGGQGFNRADDFSGNPFSGKSRLNQGGALQSSPLFLPAVSLVIRDKTGIGIKPLIRTSPLTVQDFGYQGDMSLKNQSEVIRQPPWLRKVFGIAG